MSRSKSDIATPPPKLGQHTDEVLKEIGYKPAQIKKLKEEGAV